jgi:GAF domain-containing protein
MGSFGSSAEMPPGRRPNTNYALDTSEHQAIKHLDTYMKRLVERAAALVGAPRASLAVTDPARQTLITIAAYAQDPGGLRQATLNLHDGIARWVAARRVSTVIEDLALDSRVLELNTMAVGSLLSTPLLVGQQFVGALTVSSPSISAFRPPHLRLLEALVEMAGVAILQHRQLESTTQQAQQLHIQLELARALSVTQDTQALFSVAVSGIRRLVRCEEAVIFTHDVSTNELYGTAGFGHQSAQLAERRIPLDDPQSVTAWVAQQRRPLLHSSNARAFVGPITEALASQQEMSLLSVPLLFQNQLWGVITLARPLAFETGDLRVMLAVCGLLAPALARAAQVIQG